MYIKYTYIQQILGAVPIGYYRWRQKYSPTKQKIKN